MMNWKEIWVSLFGACEWHGLNIGCLVSIGLGIVMVSLRKVVLWGMKPQTQKEEK